MRHENLCVAAWRLLESSWFGPYLHPYLSAFLPPAWPQCEGKPGGLAGLSNLGNTCFMASSLQCLSHAPPLAAFFLAGTYLRDLNATNPLGMKGELAEGFASLMRSMWRVSARCVLV